MSAHLLRLSLGQQFLQSNVKHPGKRHDFNISNKPFAAFDPLNGVFININAHQLHLIG